MASYANRAPRWVTILVALALTLIGVLGTFVGWLPDAVGIWSYVLATVVLLVGIFTKGL